MDIRYNVGELFQAAFGINSPIYITEPFFRQAPPYFDWSDVDVLPTLEEQINETETLPQSWMGTPIVFEARFDGDDGKYWRYKLNGELEEVEMKTMVLPAATMFSFRRSKNITRTNVLGSNGTVKEIYGFDDWHIDVRGLCLPIPGKTSLQQLEELLQWEKLADAIKIEGPLFRKLEIYRVAMADFAYNIPQGKPDVVAFTMQLYSDDPLELQLTNTI
ncbi:hypothetical protein EI546_06575 [Aequorivita sp. H23M31]|uniref:DUF6046 domain-containing protein n=1 Tax=Aequorivita ciconiae TaxID=2494375 RepID=A0A410G2A2_9FLAO|nr:DUF6046 domain-containing protein [Aequorivita sp. H23M31]QAA81414.1 hypothetical protein EI546_06575 [Aequorivita sp. H23M31]